VSQWFGAYFTTLSVFQKIVSKVGWPMNYGSQRQRPWPSRGNTPTASNKAWDNHETLKSGHLGFKLGILEYKPERYPDTRRSWEYIIKNHVKEKWGETWSEFIWLRIGTDGKPLRRL
jgi:hypothetical protein